MVALKRGFADHVAPPHGHRPQHRQDADDQHGPAIAMHVKNRARGQESGSNRANERPRARVDKVVGMLWRRVQLAHGYGPDLVNLRNVPAASRKLSVAGADAPETSCRTVLSSVRRW